MREYIKIHKKQKPQQIHLFSFFPVADETKPKRCQRYLKLLACLGLCPELNRGGILQSGWVIYFPPPTARVIRFLPCAPIGFRAGQKHPNPIIKPDY